MKKFIKNFLDATDAYDAFITGPAGSGKTTALKEVVKVLNNEKINFIVTAYTHKAKDVLASKLPKDTKITTLHSFLKKRPGINPRAKHIKQLQISTKMGKPEQIELIIVDEFSFIGESDGIDLQALQDPIELELFRCKKCGNEFNTDFCDCGASQEYYEDISLTPVKILYVGDLNQLSPIKGPSYIEPYGDFHKELKKVYRNNFPQLQKLVKFIEGTEPISYLEPTDNFKRKVDIDKVYKQSKEESKIMLAFTNQAVQEHNANIQGRNKPRVGDEVYISSMKTTATIIDILDDYEGDVLTPLGIINQNTKYNPLKYMKTICKFYVTTEGVYAGIFGSYNNKIVREEVAKELVEANKKDLDSKKIYRKYKILNDYICIIDFNHCMTVHKSQGSEFNEVYVDIDSFKYCIDKLEKLKLLYVAMSRAKVKIYLNR